MPVVRFTDDVVTERFLNIDTVAEAAALKGGVVGDYAVGDYPAGSTRDQNGVVTAFTPPTLSDAERAAKLFLKSADFYTALRANALIDFSDIGATETTRQWVLRKVAASALPAATKVVALDRAETASVFYRADPEIPGMMEAVGAILPRADQQAGGLTSAEIDALFLGAA